MTAKLTKPQREMLRRMDGGMWIQFTARGLTEAGGRKVRDATAQALERLGFIEACSDAYYITPAGRDAARGEGE